MDALQAVVKAATSGKSLKSRNMWWLIAIGIVDVIVLLVMAYHRPLDELTADKSVALRATLSAVLPVPILFLSYFFSHSVKAILVFWRVRNPMPGSRAFSVHAPNDQRIDLAALKKNIGEFPIEERDQNSTWYKLYKLVENDVAVVDSHQKYLMFRDIAAMSILLVPLVPLALYIYGNKPATIAWAAGLFALQYLASALAARNNGVRFVQNVLCIHATKKVVSSKRAPAKRAKEERD
ncbi:hypothetical protein [Paraburkholderia caffeinitolerans]|nr:hypothetical protein [Paraburkholderia caffeinitolerans]